MGILVGLGLTRRHRFVLVNRVVLVAGASRGLGLLIARELVARGAKVAILARDPAALALAREDLERRGGAVIAVTCDVGEAAQVESAVQAVRERFGRIDALINVAGVIEVGPEETMTVADYEEAMRTHFWGPLHTALAVLPELRTRREGRIVNISSVGGKIPVPHLLPYSASKFALTGLSEGLTAELAKDNIRVTTVCPGLMRTGSQRNVTVKGKNAEEYAWFKVSGSLPLVSMSADRAARLIVDAMDRGDAELVTTLPAKLAVLVHGLAPGLTARMLSIVHAMLPGPGGNGTARKFGHESESAISRSWVTRLTDRAAERNNELPVH